MSLQEEADKVKARWDVDGSLIIASGFHRALHELFRAEALDNHRSERDAAERRALQHLIVRE